MEGFGNGTMCDVREVWSTYECSSRIIANERYYHSDRFAAPLIRQILSSFSHSLVFVHVTKWFSEKWTQQISY